MPTSLPVYATVPADTLDVPLPPEPVDDEQYLCLSCQRWVADAAVAQSCVDHGQLCEDCADAGEHLGCSWRCGEYDPEPAWA